ncbi:hypothetical protein EOD42_00800 [Rhodovarius crocodyli]|uniref:Methyltransferase domain-containing protein n=1 Tax=Rhodovarius crocodyli TaxID=1979269 RepID=A0A437MM01_9PROT|nr:methyltransferase domain-containing protein [Rhodovarius crocodyli]RVT98684.1 hypothetical protein EOD42_00800 [Rhodovarius crocodyli]
MESHERRQGHDTAAETFRRLCAERGIAHDPRLFWYHCVDLGEGLVTPGSFDYRQLIQHYALPADMGGMRVLDIGSASGFFAFTMERLGADVTSIELPSIMGWDRFPGESRQAIIDKIKTQLKFHAPADYAAALADASPAELHHWLLDGPFRFCHRVIGSRVKRRYTTIYDTPELLAEGGPFDLVMLGDILLHLIDPLHALAAAARVCSGTLVISQDLSEDGPPRMVFTGGASTEEDPGAWWSPNLAWFQLMLPRLGFEPPEVKGDFVGHVNPGGEPFHKTVLHARKRG